MYATTLALERQLQRVLQEALMLDLQICLLHPFRPQQEGWLTCRLQSVLWLT